ncbi:hypothetical protein EYF80_024406 [Liparis tanakae]|uniref:Uncharacterized protein n=1 Tax=Liparis tanakae TaxID=230148 RepID=A0A4Z2HIK3_9TELE|nr:hypothetical protein EYF80_024406 [Liparis tanakae]
MSAGRLLEPEEMFMLSLGLRSPWRCLCSQWVFQARRWDSAVRLAQVILEAINMWYEDINRHQEPNAEEHDRLAEFVKGLQTRHRKAGVCSICCHANQRATPEVLAAIDVFGALRVSAKSRAPTPLVASIQQPASLPVAESSN